MNLTLLKRPAPERMDDAQYHKMRAQDERRRASLATNGAARRIHLELASYHEAAYDMC